MNKTQIVKYSIIGALVLGSIFLLRKRGRLYVARFTKDLKTHNEEKIKQAHPKIRAKIRQFLQLAENKGIKLRITETKRSVEDQIYYFNIGTSKVTFGFHVVALAVDVYPVLADGWSVDVNNYATHDTYLQIKEIGEKLGFKTVGYWDRPHYEMSFGYSLPELQKKYYNNEFDKNGFLKI
jgi:hypothetical protein